MEKFKGKKLLVLGGKPIGSCEIVEYAKKNGAYVIVADYLSEDDSPAKKNADEKLDISTGDIVALEKYIIENNVDAVITGINEFNIERTIDLAQRLKLPYYCDQKQWEVIDNKWSFKEICKKFDIPTAKMFSLNDSIDYPVVVKPTDSSGSRGFSICEDESGLKKAISKALEFSTEGKYLIEEFVESDACIVHYTAINGEIFYSGMSDKTSKSFNSGSKVMALQTFPSKSESKYLKTLNKKAIAMFKSLGIKEGPIWIELFNDIKNNRMLFNEAGFRLGGSMTNHVVKYYYGVDQLANMVSYSLNASTSSTAFAKIENRKKYCILPIHIKPGTIHTIIGAERVLQMQNVNAIANVHFVGDKILPWGTAQQVFCYLHVLYDTVHDLRLTIEDVLKQLVAYGDNGENMVFTLFDINQLGEF